MLLINNCSDQCHRDKWHNILTKAFENCYTNVYIPEAVFNFNSVNIKDAKYGMIWKQTEWMNKKKDLEIYWSELYQLGSTFSVLLTWICLL